MLDITTFDARAGGNVLYKALAHPLAAEAISCLYIKLAAAGPVAVVDPDDVATALLALHPDAPPIAGIFVQDVQAVGRVRAGGGVGAADIVDGRIAHASIVELLTARHVGTRVMGTVFLQ